MTTTTVSMAAHRNNSNTGAGSGHEAAKTSFILNEIVDSEKAYISNLCLLSEHFVGPLGMFSPLFKKTHSLIEDMINIHRLIFNDLSSALMMSDDDVGGFMKVFLRYIDFLKIYSAFVNEYEKLYETIRGFANDERFQYFLQERRKDPALRGNNVMSFLIMPVQRIPQYEVLFERLTHTLGPRQQIPTQLEQAYAGIKELANYLNDNKREMEQRSVILDIASRISGDDNFVLVSPSRRFLKKGDLLKLSTLNFKKRRLVYLFNDLLLWTTTSYRIRGYMDLAHAVLEEESVSLQGTPQTTPIAARKVPQTTPTITTTRKKPARDDFSAGRLDDSRLTMPAGGGGVETSWASTGSRSGRSKKKAVEQGVIDPAVAFEVLHPSKKTPLVLIAATVQEKLEWVAALRDAIANAARAETDLNLRREEVVSPSNEKHALSQYLSNALAAATAAGSDTSAVELAAAESSKKIGSPMAIKRGHRVAQSHRGLESMFANALPMAPDSPENNERKEVTRVLHAVLQSTFQSTALQQLEESIEALHALTEADMHTMWAGAGVAMDDDDDDSASFDYVDPPFLVMKVLEAVSVTMGADGVRSDDNDLWSNVTRRFVRQAHFLRLLKGHALKRLRIRDSYMKTLRSYITNPLLRMERIAQTSSAAAILWNWVRANYACQPGVKQDMVMAPTPKTAATAATATATTGGGKATTKGKVTLRRKSSASAATGSTSPTNSKAASFAPPPALDLSKAIKASSRGIQNSRTVRSARVRSKSMKKPMTASRGSGGGDDDDGDGGGVTKKKKKKRTRTPGKRRRAKDLDLLMGRASPRNVAASPRHFGLRVSRSRATLDDDGI